MQTARLKVFHMVTLVVALLLAIGVLTFAGSCVHEDGSHSVCATAATAAAVASAVAALASLVGIVVRNGTASGAAMALAACAGVFSALAPGTLFDLCMMQTMRCWTIMRPFAIACGAVICICAVVAAVRSFRAKAGRAS